MGDNAAATATATSTGVEGVASPREIRERRGTNSSSSGNKSATTSPATKRAGGAGGGDLETTTTTPPHLQIGFQSLQQGSLPYSSMASSSGGLGSYAEERCKSPPKGRKVAPPKSIQHYQLGDIIGKGAFGSVYRGLSTKTSEVVAIKVLDKDLIYESQIPILMRELEVMQKVNHPNIVRYIEYIESPNFLFFVLEYVEGGSLNDALRKFGTFSEPLVALYISQVLKALSYLHSQNIVHRDVKGANILLTKDGIVKLADLGSAVYLCFANSLNNTITPKGVSTGSPFWMAPEIIEGSRGTTTSDIWSVGCTVIELVSGKPPYWNAGQNVALFKMASDPLPPLPEGMSPELESFLKSCFVRDVLKRPSCESLLTHPWLGIAVPIKENETVQAAPAHNLHRRSTLMNIFTNSPSTKRKEEEPAKGSRSGVPPRASTREFKSSVKQEDADTSSSGQRKWRTKYNDIKSGLYSSLPRAKDDSSPVSPRVEALEVELPNSEEFLQRLRSTTSPPEVNSTAHAVVQQPPTSTANAEQLVKSDSSKLAEESLPKPSSSSPATVEIKAVPPETALLDKSGAVESVLQALKEVELPTVTTAQEPATVRSTTPSQTPASTPQSQPQPQPQPAQPKSPPSQPKLEQTSKEAVKETSKESSSTKSTKLRSVKSSRSPKENNSSQETNNKIQQELLQTISDLRQSVAEKQAIQKVVVGLQEWVTLSQQRDDALNSKLNNLLSLMTESHTAQPAQPQQSPSSSKLDELTEQLKSLNQKTEQMQEQLSKLSNQQAK